MMEVMEREEMDRGRMSYIYRQMKMHMLRTRRILLLLLLQGDSWCITALKAHAAVLTAVVGVEVIRVWLKVRSTAMKDSTRTTRGRGKQQGRRTMVAAVRGGTQVNRRGKILRIDWQGL
jgi:hypothetical protein